MFIPEEYSWKDLYNSELSMSIATFQQQIEEAIKKKVKLKINDNHSTMLSVKWDPDCTKISMHRMFLEAPSNIMEALACYIQKENDPLCPTVQAYIDEKLRTSEYTYQLSMEKIVTKGKYYDLQALYDSLNNEYFDGQLNLSITWFGKNSKKKERSQLILGLYQSSLQLIKIHKMMDNLFFPEYFVKFVIYHEIIHHVSPSYYDKDGKHHIHSKEFKELERKFHDYHLAKSWMKKHYDNLFTM